jgi:hypothetical protein
MDPEQRSNLLRQRLRARRFLAAPIVAVRVARGLVRSKEPPKGPPREGVTEPTHGWWGYDPFSLNLRPMTPKWMKKPGVKKKPPTCLKLKRRQGVSPLVRIAAKFPQKVPRQ